MCYVVQQFKLFFSEIIKAHFISSAQHLGFFFFFPYNALCPLGPHGEVVGRLYPQKQEPHLRHTALDYWAWPGPSSPASCFHTAPPFAAAMEKGPYVARDSDTKHIL